MDKLEISDYCFEGHKTFKLKEIKTKIKDLYESKEEYESLLLAQQAEIDHYQNVMFADSRYGVLVVFQAMDAAGKDGTMRAVFKNVHPLGLSFYSFKRPSETELKHDFMWRCFKQLPERGHIKVFNRSYYEEVLVVKVRPEILLNFQKIPKNLTLDVGKVWENRYRDIVNFENYLANNGIKVIKLFLNVSKKEQGERLIERIEDINKNWKFEEGDIKERALWKEYQAAYEEMINKTSTKENPWYVVPADDKRNMRLIVAKIIAENLKKLEMDYPAPDELRKQTLVSLIDTIKQQDLED